jgi:hypothetical protein
MMANILGFLQVRMNKESLVISCGKIVLLVCSTCACTILQFLSGKISSDKNMSK